MLGVVISPVHFGRDLFSYSNFNFFCIDNKGETNWIVRSRHSIFNYPERYISIITSNKRNQEPAATSSNISITYKKLLQTFRKSIYLVNEFFLINSFIGVFEEYYDKFYISYLAKHHLFLVFFPLYCRFVATT